VLNQNNRVVANHTRRVSTDTTHTPAREHACLHGRASCETNQPSRQETQVATTLKVNGKTVSVKAEADTPLLWVVRDELGLTGTKFGCGAALCGACTVHLDGDPVRPCIVPVSQAEGRAVTTIEGVLRTPLGRALEQAWAADGLQSCDQCRPGRIMAAAALLAQGVDAPDEEIEALLDQHACDCGQRGAAAAALKRAARRALGAASASRAERPGGGTVDASSPAPAPEGAERSHR
jgi:isoquinoline 1-oxidoreductase alpha subunit